MLVSDVKRKYNTFLDEAYTGYFNNVALTDIFQKACLNIIEQKLEHEGSTDKIDHELNPLRFKTSFIGSSLTLSSIDYHKFGSLSVDFGNGPRMSMPLKLAENNSVYSEGTKRYPKHYEYNDGSNHIIDIYPNSVDANNELFYYKKPLVSNGTQFDFTIADYDIKYTDKLIDLIISEALLISGNIMREQAISITSFQNEQNNQ